MSDRYKAGDYYVTVGIECHVQLKTKTKLFSSADNDAREAPANTLINHIDLGMPGALPVLNEEAVRLACRAAFAIGSSPQKYSKFDRKHYFYPDLPMGYQISQFDEPIILGGEIEIDVEGNKKTIGITRAHLEADAGKSTHPKGADYSLVDLNRAGTPLLEIVSEPEITSPVEAKAYARELYLRMKFAGVSEANLYYGNMRFDVNVSVSKDEATLGTRSETKNLNSFKSVEKAVEYEVKRQVELLEKGDHIVQETRGWDDDRQKTFSQRSKEDAHDYRYMPDPDLPPVILDDEYIGSIKAATPTLPNEWRELLRTHNLEPLLVEALLDSEVEFENQNYLDLFRQIDDKELLKRYANWVVNLFVPLMRDKGLGLKVDDRIKLIRSVHILLDAGSLSSTNSKKLITELTEAQNVPDDITAYAESKSYLQVSDSGELDKIVKEVLVANQKAAEDVKSGEMKAVGYLVGQCMKASKGQGNPTTFHELIKKQLGV
ncbi:MAG: Asp-tRNA(Asn)/Glu-tRNA(Gln) amidotransferase subunit GatB [bacterium]|nr:Asp-tRNA(Asn)/Glu-tRNA(Gln) amidotransferase subunit GatB [bacterium]